MFCSPSCGCEVGEGVDQDTVESWQDVGEVFAHRGIQRQLSMTETMASTFGPACALLTWNPVLPSNRVRAQGVFGAVVAQLSPMTVAFWHSSVLVVVQGGTAFKLRSRNFIDTGRVFKWIWRNLTETDAARFLRSR